MHIQSESRLLLKLTIPKTLLVINMEGSDKNDKHSAISHTKKEKIQDHTIFVNGFELHQRKEMSAVNPKIKQGQIQYRHMRRINNDSIEVIEVREPGHFKEGRQKERRSNYVTL